MTERSDLWSPVKRVESSRGEVREGTGDQIL